MRRAGSKPRVEAVEVIVHHTTHRIVRCDEVHRVLHRLYPAIRIGLPFTIEVEWYDLLLQKVVDRRSVELVLQRLVAVGTLVGECPTCALAVAFVPPAVEDREIEYTIHLCLLTRRTRSFERSCRSVHPDIDPCDELARQTHIVVLEEDDLTEELWTTADLQDVLDESLTATISRVCLTSEEELHGVLRIVDDALQTL